jgi:hypothetical protein
VRAEEADFHEATARPRVESVPFAHLSIELGHLYMEDFEAGEDFLAEQFRQVAPWVAAARQACAQLVAPRTPRISTCFLVDDYFTRFSSPDVVVPQLVRAAAASDLRIDYLARESGCAQADGVMLARLVEDRLVPEPPPGTNGSRPPLAETGWLCNGQRSPSGTATEAMGAVRPWRPPTQNAANRHSIFLDVELWDDGPSGRTWSCPFLAAVWQLLRLGMLRYEGRRVGVPQALRDGFPSDWDRLPAVVQLNDTAYPFSAYRTMSVLASRFLPIEHAVRTIVSQVAVDSAVARQAVDRAAAEGLALPRELVERIDYVFAGTTAALR